MEASTLPKFKFGRVGATILDRFVTFEASLEATTPSEGLSAHLIVEGPGVALLRVFRSLDQWKAGYLARRSLVVRQICRNVQQLKIAPTISLSWQHVGY